MKLPFRDWRLLLVTLVLFLIVTVLPAWSLWPVSPPPARRTGIAHCGSAYCSGEAPLFAIDCSGERSGTGL
jgi:hypothetical protein